MPPQQAQRGGAHRPHRTVFVTVGTTKFDALIRAVDRQTFADALVAAGYTRLVMQIGRWARAGPAGRAARWVCLASALLVPARAQADACMTGPTMLQPRPLSYMPAGWPQRLEPAVVLSPPLPTLPQGRVPAPPPAAPQQPLHAAAQRPGRRVL